MFGSRLKSWMENYIGRPKKKVQVEGQKGKPKGIGTGGLILESSESLAQSDTGVSSGSQQVLSSSTTDHREGYSTATMDSDRSGLVHCQTAISLPSPESAYSTGYSTDGTSPGGTGPPEYYINIRTGKHYFPSPAPTPTSPHPDTAFAQLYSVEQCPTKSFFPGEQCLPPRLIRPPRSGRDSSAAGKSRLKSHLQTLPDDVLSHFTSPAHERNTLSGPTPSGQMHLDAVGFSKPLRKKTSSRGQCTSLKLFLKSPKRDAIKSRIDISKSPPFDCKRKSPSPSKAKKWFKQPFHKFGHRRIDSCDENASNHARKELDTDRGLCYLPAQDAAASPRQRNRIKTNPWLPTAPPTSQLFRNLPPTFPAPVLSRNRSCSNTPLQNRKSADFELPAINRGQQLADLEKTIDSFPSQNVVLNTSDRSEEDLTLNEMMGTYNESYVYEKETDILSDSDPTDCDDYETDSEAEKGGDERDSHDDELDFIDNASLSDSDDSCPPNTGRCTYHDVCANRNSFLCKGDRRYSRKDPEQRRSLRRSHEYKGRRERRKLSKRCSKCEDEERKKQQEGKTKQRPEIDETMGGLSLRKVLMQRVLAKSVPRGAEGSPTVRRKGRSDENASENIGVNVTLADQEADRRYKELMKEAEHMFESLRNSPVIKNKRNTPLKEDDGLRIEKSLVTPKERDKTCCIREFETKLSETPVRKSPKNLALKLSVDAPKKPGGLHLDGPKKTSFKARSSAHSPLDPLGPTLRNFSVFQSAEACGREIPTSSSDDSDPSEAFRARAPAPAPAPDSPLVPIAFQSVDLGKPLTSYCPQSEPVKRKIYSCSKTYDRLVKHLEKNPDIFEEAHVGTPHDQTPPKSHHPSSLRLSHRRPFQLFA